VLVHGSLNDRTAWRAVQPAFEERHTVYAMDRRGRGESGPPAEHTLERQFEDVVAVIDAAGGPVDLLGHSYGARCALGAAALVPHKVKHLVLYEPPAAGQERIDIGELFEKGDPSKAVERFMVEIIGVPPDQMKLLQASTFWSYLVSFAPTMPFEGRALFDQGFDPSDYASLRMPALFLVGSESQERIGWVLRELRTTMQHAEWHVFEGHGHAATLTAPKLFTDTVLEFLAR
jgi:pimeloyl-ACP methyl ester carboxylesterase